MRNKLLDPMELLAEIEALKAERDEALKEVKYIEEVRDFAIAEARNQIAASQAAVARLEGLLTAITCDEADAKDCERYCFHEHAPLHAEARSIRARQS